VDNRSTILSARVTDAPRDTKLIEVDLRGLSGVPLLGRRVRLDFDTKLTFAGGDTYSKLHPSFDLWAEVTVSKEHGSPPRQLGALRLSEPAFVVPNANDAGSWTRSARLRLELDHRQLDDIEEVRSGGGLLFSLALDGVIHLPDVTGRLYPSNNSIWYEVGQSDWIRLLAQVQYGTYITIEVALPKPGKVGGDLAAAADALQQATEALRRGADEEAVADCRDAFEALVRLAGGTPQTKFGDQSLIKDERFVYVAKALHNVAHLAHHPRDKAATGGAGKVNWDRADAEAAIAVLAALIRRMGGE